MPDRSIVIDGNEISDDSPCWIIAELGHNHQGDVDKAKALIREAKSAGASAVKLQKRDNRSLYVQEMYHQPYDNENSFGLTYGEHRDFLELGRDEYLELQAYSKELGVTFFATAFDFPSVDFLGDLNVPVIKIASGDIRNVPLLTYAAKLGKPLIISTGGATMDDVRRAHDCVADINPQIALLQCTASYPAAFEELDLGVITTFRQEFPDAVIGLSAHDSGIAMALVGYVLGARIIEKHLTLNRAMKGTDHAFSLEPVGLRKLVRDLTRTRSALGAIKRVHPSETAPILKMGKKLVAAREIPAGHVLTEQDVAIKSPGDGLPPYELPNVVGRTTLIPLLPDQAILFEDLDPSGP